ncbi:MAG: FdtA/QdtA family cupin domain-containing protein [Salinivirgaceae bacterium]|jgi:uncharacterized cupin superfamily protein|nr:FdtA/QdtA family cupin domain-containing protein [Salinivirgaceae bacterium]
MNAQLINLPKIEDPRGNLSFVQDFDQIPFKIARIYWIYDVPGGQELGRHAHKNHQEFIIALSGSVDIVVDDGSDTQKFQLNRSYYGLYLGNCTWRYMENFSTNSLILVLSSSKSSVEDYIDDYQEYLKYRKHAGC